MRAFQTSRTVANLPIAQDWVVTSCDIPLTAAADKGFFKYLFRNRVDEWWVFCPIFDKGSKSKLEKKLVRAKYSSLRISPYADISILLLVGFSSFLLSILLITILITLSSRRLIKISTTSSRSDLIWTYFPHRKLGSISWTHSWTRLPILPNFR